MELKFECKRTFTFGTWNVRGLTEKKRETFAEIERENKDIVVLTETKLRGSAKEEYNNYVHIYSGITIGEARAGVSVLLKKEHAKHMQWKAINERIIKVRLKIFEKNVVVLAVYWVDNSSHSQTKDRFQKILEDVIRRVKKDYELVILGDMNAWVGISTSSKVVGQFGEDQINNNGRRLIEVCDKYCLKIQNTFFKHDDIHKYTWHRPRSYDRSIVDYCITRQTTAIKIIDVLSCRWLDCGTDHTYLEAIAELPTMQTFQSHLKRYNSYLLFSETIEKMYKQHLDENIILTKHRSSNELYLHLSEVIHSAACHVLGDISEKECSEFLWDEELRAIISAREMNCGRGDNNNIRSRNSILQQDSKIKNEVWKGICETIDIIPNQYQKNKAIWNILNEFQNHYGNALSKDKEMIKQYFKETRPEFINAKEDIKKYFKLSIFPADIISALDEFEDEDVPSPGGISMRLLKHASKKMIELLKDLVQTIFNGQIIPDEINETFLIYQTDKKQPNNLNTHKYVPHAIMQIMSMIIKNFIEKECSIKAKCRIIHEESRLRATFILRLLIQKCVEKQNKPLHLVFIDLEDTLIDLPRVKLFAELHTSIIGEALMGVIKHLYKENKMRVFIPGENLENFPVTKGLKKECPLSPTLFQIYIRKAVKEWIKENDKKGFPVANVKLFSLISQNTNLVIISDNSKHLGSIVEGLRKHLKKINLYINFRNLKYLSVGDEQAHELKIGRNSIASENSFEFIGSVLEFTGRNETDIYNRIVNTKNAIGVLHSVARDQVISKENKKRIFHSVIENFLTFGCETWTMTKQLMGRLDTVEMAYWKWCCEKYPEFYSKEEIYEEMVVRENISDIVELKRAAWYARVKMMPQHKWPKCVLEWKPDGKAKTGRRRKWIEGIEEFINDLSFREGFVTKSRHLQNFMRHNRPLREIASTESDN